MSASPVPPPPAISNDTVADPVLFFFVIAVWVMLACGLWKNRDRDG